MKVILDFIINKLEGVLRLVRQVVNFVRSLGFLNKTQVDEHLLKIIDFLLEVHPELVRISKQFTISVLSQEFKEHPEVFTKLVDSNPTAALDVLKNVVETQATLVGDLDTKTFPAEVLREESRLLLEQTEELDKEFTSSQLEKAKVENYLRYGKYELPPKDSPIWNHLKRD